MGGEYMGTRNKEKKKLREGHVERQGVRNERRNVKGKRVKQEVRTKEME
jgi:hypothetical protein